MLRRIEFSERNLSAMDIVATLIFVAQELRMQQPFFVNYPNNIYPIADQYAKKILRYSRDTALAFIETTLTSSAKRSEKERAALSAAIAGIGPVIEHAHQLMLVESSNSSDNIIRKNVLEKLIDLSDSLTPVVPELTDECHERVIQDFHGRLYYDDSRKNEHIEMADFIVRQNEIAFSVTSVSAKYGRWSAHGVARRVDGNSFIATGVQAKQQGTKAGDYWTFELEVERMPSGHLYVEGNLLEGGEKYSFAGDLDPKNASPHVR